MEWSAEKINETVNNLCIDYDKAEILSNNKDKIIARYKTSNSETIIIKLWSRQHLGGKFRRLIGSSLAENEWNALNHAKSLNINVPKAFGWCQLVNQPKNFTEALIIEDLGDCRIADEYIKHCFSENAIDDLIAFERSVIEMTAKMVEGKLLDVDHSLINIVMSNDNTPYRIDFELAKSVNTFNWHFYSYGKMLGRLLATYSFAVQPQTYRVPEFFEQLCKDISVPSLTIWVAKRHFNEFMDKQEAQYNIKSEIRL